MMIPPESTYAEAIFSEAEWGGPPIGWGPKVKYMGFWDKEGGILIVHLTRPNATQAYMDVVNNTEWKIMECNHMKHVFHREQQGDEMSDENIPERWEYIVINRQGLMVYSRKPYVAKDEPSEFIAALPADNTIDGFDLREWLREESGHPYEIYKMWIEGGAVFKLKGHNPSNDEPHTLTINV